VFYRFISLFFTLSLLANCQLATPLDSALAPFGFTAQSHACLSEALYHEARGTTTEGIRAVGEVILNRSTDPGFPSSICGVIDQRYNGSCQFSYRCDSISVAVFNEPSELARVQSMALILLTDRQQDITNGALFFHAARMNPGWFSTLSPRGQFGGNLFYR